MTKPPAILATTTPFSVITLEMALGAETPNIRIGDLAITASLTLKGVRMPLLISLMLPSAAQT